MTMFDLSAIVLVLAALLAWSNKRFIGLPDTIGVMSIALLLSLGMLGLDFLGVPSIHAAMVDIVRAIDFSDVLMQGMLSMLLFAGALHVDLASLRTYRWHIGLLAVAATAASTALIACAMYVWLPAVGVALPFAFCLLFGALISPTDPIAVLNMLKSARAPREVAMILAGESLFNDGVGVVLFTVFAGAASSGALPDSATAASILLQGGLGGCAFGWLLGHLTCALLRTIDSYQEEVLITLAAVVGGYALAQHLHVSGPLAMVVAGLIIGNSGRAHGMSAATRQRVDMFWELLDSMLNAVLFVLIGLEIAVIAIPPRLLFAGLMTVAITLLVRFVTVGLPLGILGRRTGLARGTGSILAWGGLRGGISVALALALPTGQERDIVVGLTYAVVIFSILLQGLSMRAVVRHLVPSN